MPFFTILALPAVEVIAKRRLTAGALGGSVSVGLFSSLPSRRSFGASSWSLRERYFDLPGVGTPPGRAI